MNESRASVSHGFARCATCTWIYHQEHRFCALIEAFSFTGILILLNESQPDMIGLTWPST